MFLFTTLNRNLVGEISPQIRKIPKRVFRSTRKLSRKRLETASCQQIYPLEIGAQSHENLTYFPIEAKRYLPPNPSMGGPAIYRHQGLRRVTYLILQEINNELNEEAVVDQ